MHILYTYMHVYRIEQTETPEMLKDRNTLSKTKKDKVVARELCSIMSKGTRTYCHLDDLSALLMETNDSGHSSSFQQQQNSILLCIKELTPSTYTTATTTANTSHASHNNDSNTGTSKVYITTNNNNNDDEDVMNIECTINGEGKDRPVPQHQQVLPEYGLCCIDTILGTYICLIYVCYVTLLHVCVNHIHIHKITHSYTHTYICPTLQVRYYSPNSKMIPSGLACAPSYHYTLPQRYY